jgi:outer membrane protein OmpA-like peptidoglycan-associated protein
MRKTIYLALFTCLSLSINAQYIRSPWSYGIYGGMQQSIFTGQFKELPGMDNCCSGFSGTSNLNDPFFGISIEHALNKNFTIGLSLDYVKSRGAYSTINTIGNALSFNGTGFDIVEAQSEHRVSFALPSVGITSAMAWRPFQSGFGMKAGFELRMQQESESFGEEELISPKGVIFSDTKSTIRNSRKGTFTPESMIYGPTIGIFHDFHLSESIILRPELSYTHFLNDPIIFDPSSESLSLHVLRAGIMIAYTAITPETLLEIPITPLPVIEEEKPYQPKRLKASLSAFSVNEQSKEENIVKITIEEYSSLLMTPLLNAVFFEEGEHTIPERYATLEYSDTPLFDIDFIHTPNHVETYLHILNIVGKRMLEKPNAILTLTGCNADIQKEKGDKALSLRRAESVKQYLQQVWNIPDSRIILKNRNLPEKHANTQTAMGAQENRRVEINADDAYIISPIITLDTIRTMNPPIVRFRPTVEVDSVDTWQLTAGKSERELRRFTGNTVIPPFIDWYIGSEMSEKLMNDTSITFQFKAITSLKDSAEINGELPIEQVTLHKKKINRVQDREVNTFSLILFDVRSSDINKANADIIEFIKGYVKPNSTINITGYTDRLGDATANQKLAQDRADATAKSLNVKLRATVSAKGNSALYDDRFPEGRLYTRTVDVIVDTRIDN